MPEPSLIACEAVAPALRGIDGVSVVQVPCRYAPCGAFAPGAAARSAILSPAQASGRVLAGCCQLSRDLAPGMFAAHDCVELLTGRTLLRQLTGACVVTSWWLRRWDEGGRTAAARDARGTELPPSGEAVLVTIDRDPHAVGLLEVFARSVGLGPRCVVIGGELLRASAERAALEAQLAAERVEHAAATTSLREQLTTAATALEIFSQMAGHTDEASAVSGILDLFTILFAPRVVRLTVQSRIGHAGRTWSTSHEDAGGGPPLAAALESPNEYEWTQDGRGFRLRISSHGRPFGAIEVDGLAFPQYRERYLNMAIPIARACGMVIANAGAMQGLVTVCASCHRLRDRKGAWQQLEAYLAQQQHVEFSHAICPDCYRRLYPDFPMDDFA